MSGLFQFAGWLATQVFDVVGSVAGAPSADDRADGNVDLQVGKTVFHDVPPKMRTELWMSQLQRRSARGAASMAEYRDLLFEKLSEDVLSEIDKDTHRTFPGHPRLCTPAGQQAMLNVLRAYALSDPEIGYTQGMNFLAGLLLTYLPSEAEAYSALSLLMRQRGLREMYKPDMALLQIRLWQLGKLLPPRLAEHLEAHAVLPVLYASSWLLTCFAADFPFHFAARVMDVLLTGHQVASPVLKIAVSIVSRCEHDLLKMDDFEEMVHYLRQEVPRWPRQALQDMLTDALSKPWTARQLKVLDEINGAETVMEAVARVNNLVQQPTCDAAEVQAMLEGAGSSAAPSPTAGAAAAAAARPSPRSVARSLSSSFQLRPLPPPPSGRGEAVPWEAWQAADLRALATQQVRIDESVEPDLVDLDPHLSQALSAYSHVEPSGASFGFTSFQLAVPPHQQQQQQQGGAEPGAAAAAPDGSGGGGRRPAAAAASAAAEEQQGEAGTPSASPAKLQTPLSPSISSPAEMQARWDAFADATTRCLSSAPSPFDATPPGAAPPPGEAGLKFAVTFDVSQLQALRQAAAAGAAQPGGPAERYGADPEAAASYGSFQMGTQHSALPLVDVSRPLQAQQGQQAQQGAGSGTPTKRRGILGLFGQARAAGAGKQPSPAADGSSDLIQEVPSSHGSSLAAVLSQLGLSDGGSGASAPAAAGSQRQLHHSGDAQGWGSFKTAHGSSQGGLSVSSHPLTADGSWHSAAQCARQDSDGSHLSSTASSHLPPVAPAAEGAAKQQAAAAAPAAAGSSAAAGTPASTLAQGQLRGVTASQRAISLQEEHIQGFLASGKEQASRAAEKDRLGLSGSSGKPAKSRTTD